MIGSFVALIQPDDKNGTMGYLYRMDSTLLSSFDRLEEIVRSAESLRKEDDVAPVPQPAYLNLHKETSHIFYICVLYQQRNTVQGEAIWTSRGRKRTYGRKLFRTGAELLGIIKHTMEQSARPPCSGRWDK